LQQFATAPRSEKEYFVFWIWKSKPFFLENPESLRDFLLNAFFGLAGVFL